MKTPDVSKERGFLIFAIYTSRTMPAAMRPPINGPANRTACPLKSKAQAVSNPIKLHKGLPMTATSAGRETSK